MNKCPFKVRSDLEAMPSHVSTLPIDERGYPVPWFVAWQYGKPEFRAMDAEKRVQAVNENRCWVCGNPMGRFVTFVVGPMCGINRTSAEPPSHLECAEWSARNCPFLSRPSAKRREDDLINNETLISDSPGTALTRNPGVTLLWTTTDYQLFGDGSGGWLIRLGEAIQLAAYREGRRASLEELFSSVESGLPYLLSMAKLEGAEAVAELGKMRGEFELLAANMLEGK